MKTGSVIRKIGVRGLLLAVLTATAAGPAAAQIPAPAQERPIALVGGTLHTVSGGVIEGGTIVFDNGVITALGRDVEIRAGAERIDVTGRHIYPGLIDAYSMMGISEIGAFAQTVDVRELGDINPNARAAVAFNPESRHIGVARSNGVLVTVSSPGGGLIAGQASTMMLDGWTWEEMTLDPSVGLVVQWPWTRDESRYLDGIRQLREAFADARAYRTAVRAGEGLHDFDSRWDAMIPVLDGELPVIVAADEVRQIQDAVAWAEEEGVRLIIRGGRDAGYIAEQLAERRVPVIVTPVIAAPGRAWEPYDASYALPATLYRAGVPFAISGESSPAYANRLPYEAGAATAFGLPADEALKAVTLYPAQILGLDDRIGSLEVGKDATLFITTGDPLEYASVVEQAFIEGRKIDMMDAQRSFFEKYREKVRRTSARSGTTDD